MKKIEDRYESYELDKYFQGGAVVYSVSEDEVKMSNYKFHILDLICEKEGLNKIGNSWQSISNEGTLELLHNMFRYDLAYLKTEVLTEEESNEILRIVLQDVGNDIVSCYANWDRNPWLFNGNGGFTPITSSTLDMAIVIQTATKCLLVYKMGED